MLPALRRCAPRRAALERLLSITSSAALSLPSEPTGRDEEAPILSRTKRDNRMRFFVISHRPQQALDLLEKSILRTPSPFPASLGAKVLKLPPASVCNKVLHSAAQEPALLGRAAELAEALWLQDVPVEGRTLQALLFGLIRLGKAERALPLFDRWLAQQAEALEDDATAEGAPLQALTALMDAAARADSPTMVLQVLARMAAVGLTPTVPSMTSLLQCFMRLGQVETAHSVLEWMRRSGVPPNVITYTALLTQPRRVTDADRGSLLAAARAVHAELRDAGVAPNARFFTAYLGVCGRVRSMGAAEEAWAGLAEAGVQPDLILYSAMIDVCAKCKDGQAALGIYAEMQGRGVQPDVVAYAALLAALQGSPHAAEDARRVWGSMRGKGVEPNGFAAAAYLEILLAGGETDEALGLLAEVGSVSVRGSSGGHEPEAEGGAAGAEAAGPEASSAGTIDLLRLYEHSLFYLAHQGQWAAMAALAGHMRSQALGHTPGTAAALLTGQALRRGQPRAKWLLQKEEWQPAGPYSEPAEGGAEGEAPAAPPAGSSSSSSSAALDLPPEVADACLLEQGGQGVEACMASMLRALGDRQEPVSIDAANVVLGALAASGRAADAAALFGAMQLAAGRGRLQLDAWSHKLLLFAALNAGGAQPAAGGGDEGAEEGGRQGDAQFELVVDALSASRRQLPAGRGTQQQQPWLDARTRRAVLAVMRRSQRARQELGASLAGEGDEEARMAQLRALLGA